MAFLDAMARGLCVVTPDRPTMNEYIEHGVSGLLFEPAAPTRLVVSNWKAIGVAGRRKLERLSHNFDTDLKILRLFLKSQLAVPASAAVEEADPGKCLNGRKVLLVFPHNPFLRSNGVQSRFLGLLEYFSSRGIVVDMLSHSNFVDKWDEDDPQVKRLLRSLYLEDFKQAKASGLAGDVENSPLPDFAFRSVKSRFDELVRAGSYDLIIMGYVHWANLIRDVTNIRTLIMVEDCISQNLMERDGGNGKFDYDSSIEEEARRVDLFDMAAFISSDEMKLFSQFCRNVKMFHVPHMLEIPVDSNQDHEYGKRCYDLIFVGSDNPFNVSAMRWFFSEVWPRIAETTTLAVVGQVCNELRKYGDIPAGGNLHMMGRVDDLNSVYDQSKIAICPMLQGTGLKIKAAEALAHGLPVVALPAGLIGMTGNRHGCVEVHTSEQFERAIRSILASPNGWATQSAMARKTAKELFGRENVAKALDLMLDHTSQMAKILRRV
jgi:glycosyltransferase involved in cell wall biosynthesis